MRAALYAPAAVLALSALTVSALAADPMPPPSILPYGNAAGARIENGIFVDITAAGWNQFTQLVDVFIPETVPIDTSGLTQADDIFNLGGFVGASYEVTIKNVYVEPELYELNITPLDGTIVQQGSTNYKNGRLDILARLSTDVSSQADPAEVRVKLNGTFIGFDFTLLNQACDLWIEKEELGEARVTTQIALGPKKTLYGLTGRACDPGQICGDQLSGVTCEDACDDNIPAQCQYEAISSGFRVQDGGDICFPPGESPPQPGMCYESERPPWLLPVPRECNGYIEPYAALAPVQLTLPDLDVFETIGRDCDGFLEFLLYLADFTNLLPDVNAILAETVAPAIDGAVEDLIPQVQESIDRELWIEQSIDLLGTPLELSIGPGDLFVDDRGLRLEIWSRIGGTRINPHPCVARYIGVGEDGSRRTVPQNPLVDTYPQLGDAFTGLSQPAQITALVDDDVLNQALFGVWRDGLLCQQLASDTLPFELPAGINLDTSILKAFAQGQLDDLFPEPGPLIIATRPREAPVLDVVDGPDGASAEIGLDGFGVDLYAEMDGRYMRVVGLDLGGDLGASATPSFDQATSTLALDIGFDLDGLQPTPTFNDLAPGASQPIADGLGTILRTIAGSLLDDALGQAIEFEIPRVFGIGVDEVLFGATGADPTELKDYLGVYGTIGFDEDAAGAGGCDLLGGGAGGCGGSGGAGGCDSGGGGGLGCNTVPARMVTLFVLPLVVAGLRRRRRR